MKKDMNEDNLDKTYWFVTYYCQMLYDTTIMTDIYISNDDVFHYNDFCSSCKNSVISLINFKQISKKQYNALNYE